MATTAYRRNSNRFLRGKQVSGHVTQTTGPGFMGEGCTNVKIGATSFTTAWCTINRQERESETKPKQNKTNKKRKQKQKQKKDGFYYQFGGVERLLDLSRVRIKVLSRNHGLRSHPCQARLERPTFWVLVFGQKTVNNYKKNQNSWFLVFTTSKG